MSGDRIPPAARKPRRFRLSRFEQLEARTMFAVDVLRLSPSYLENLNLVESEFIERVRNADRNQDGVVSTRDALASVDDQLRFDETIGVIEDWVNEVSEDIARRLHSLDPERWASLGAPVGDPPGGGEGGEGGETGGEQPPGGGGPPPPGGGSWHGSNPGGGNPVDLFGVSYEFDIDAAIVKVVSKMHTPTGVLAEGKEDSDGAWLLVNNDNDDFNQVDPQGNPVQGEDPEDQFQASPVVNEDDLLPIVLRANPNYPDGWFTVSHTGGIRVYEDAQKTTLATRGYSTGVDTQLFVEGLSAMLANAITYDILSMNLFDEFHSFVAYDVDSIRINRFIISGPTSVPENSRYIYNASGVDPTQSDWDDPTSGSKTAVTWDNAASFSDWQEIKFDDVLPGPGPRMGKVVYALPNGYEWGLDVAIVEVFLATNAWTGGPDITLAPYIKQGRYGDNSIADDLIVSPVGAKYFGEDHPGSHLAYMALAKLVIKGPVKNSRVRGVGDIQVGFVQNVTHRRWYAEYGSSISWRRTDPLNVPLLDGSEGSVWYDPEGIMGDFFPDDELYSTGPNADEDFVAKYGEHPNPAVDFPGVVTYTVPIGQSERHVSWIDMSDSPYAKIAPAWFDQASSVWLTDVFGKWDFTLYVAARTKQSVITSPTFTPQEFLEVSSVENPESAITPDINLQNPLDSSNLYFQVAYANWSFEFDGSVSTVTWTKSDSDGLIGDSHFKETGLSPATLVPKTTGPVANTPHSWYRRVE